MDKTFKPGILSALILGCAMLGDTFLYAALPANAASLQIPVVWTGFLLSINRFIRIFFNQGLVVLFARYGFKKITVAGAVLAVLSTFMYGIASGLFIWITARVIWAVSYAALRISSVSYSLDTPRQGFGLGLGRSLQETGPLIGLVLGSFLLQWVGLQKTFILLAVASVSSVILALFLPERSVQKVREPLPFSLIPSTSNMLVFMAALVFEGMLVVLLGRLFSGYQLSAVELTALCASCLMFRRVCLLLISPLAGYVADKIGIEKVFLSSVLISIVALPLIYFQYTLPGIFMAFAANSATAALGPGVAVSDKADPIHELAANATWRDMGAAFGALSGGGLISVRSPEIVFLIATFVLLVALITHTVKTTVYFKKMISWK